MVNQWPQVQAQTCLLELLQGREVSARITRVMGAIRPLREPPNRLERSCPCTKTPSLQEWAKAPLVSTARASDRRRTSARLQVVAEEVETSTTALLIPHKWPGDRTTAMKVMNSLSYKFGSLKEMVHPEMKTSWKCTRPKAIQDVDEFVSSSEQIWRNVALHHLLTSGASAVNGCRSTKAFLSLNCCFWLKYESSIHKNAFSSVTDWLECCYSWNIVMFWLSIWRHPFTAEDPLVSKWCNAKFLQICSDEEINFAWPEAKWVKNLKLG